MQYVQFQAGKMINLLKLEDLKDLQRKNKIKEIKGIFFNCLPIKND